MLVAVYGIQQYEQSHSKESSAVNLNVTMSVSPQDNKSTVTNSCFMGEAKQAFYSLVSLFNWTSFRKWKGKRHHINDESSISSKKESGLRGNTINYIILVRQVSPKPKIVLVPAAMMVGAI